MEIWTRSKAATLAIGTAMSLSAATLAQAEDKVLKIGMALAQTEFMALWDQPASVGINIAIEEINAGDHGVKIETISQDTRSESAQSILITREMIDQGIDVLVMSAGNADIYAVSPLVQQAGLLTFSPESSLPDLNSLAGGWIKSATGPDNGYPTHIARFAVEDLGAKTAYIHWSPDDPFLENTPKYFQREFEKLGGNIIGDGSYSVFQQEFGNTVQNIKNLPEEPDVIFTSTFEPDFPIFLKQLRAAGVNSAVMDSGSIDTPTTLALGEGYNKVYFPIERPENIADHPALKNYKKKIEEVYGDASFLDSFTLTAYIWTYMLLDAVKETGSTDSADLKAWFDNLENHETPYNTYTFKGSNTPLTTYYIVELDGGKLTYHKEVRFNSLDEAQPAIQ